MAVFKVFKSAKRRLSLALALALEMEGMAIAARIPINGNDDQKFNKSEGFFHKLVVSYKLYVLSC